MTDGKICPPSTRTSYAIRKFVRTNVTPSPHKIGRGPRFRGQFNGPPVSYLRVDLGFRVCEVIFRKRVVVFCFKSRKRQTHTRPSRLQSQSEGLGPWEPTASLQCVVLQRGTLGAESAREAENGSQPAWRARRSVGWHIVSAPSFILAMV